MLHDQPSHCVATSAHLHQIHAAGQPGDIQYHFPGALLANRNMYAPAGKIMDTDLIPGYSFSFHGKSSRNRIGIYVECTIGKIVNAGNHGTHRDGEGQRGGIVGRHVAVRVCRRVGVLRRRRGGGGRCAGEVAGARVKRQPGGNGRGQGVGDGTVATGGFRQGQCLNRCAHGVGLVVYARIRGEGRGGVCHHRDAEGQRGDVARRGVGVPVGDRVGVLRHRGDGGWRARKYASR